MSEFKIIDGHCDTLLLFDNPNYNFHGLNQVGHIDMERLISTNVLLQFFAIFVEPKMYNQALEIGLTTTNKMLKAIEKDHRLFLVKNSKDLSKLESGKVGVLLSLEGGEVINKSIDLLDVFYELGIRALTLTWNNRNWICDGISEESGSGLTTFGKEVVNRLYDNKMILDVSHLSVKGFWDCVSIGRGPILASHSNSMKLCAHIRNLSDEQIKAIAQSDGLIGINFFPSFLSDNTEDATIDSIINHMIYIADLVGVKHVALGSDFDGVNALPKGINDVRDFKSLSEKMLKRGFSSKDVEKIFYTNFLEFLEKTI